MVDEVKKNENDEKEEREKNIEKKKERKWKEDMTAKSQQQ